MQEVVLRVNDTVSEEFMVKGGVHEGSVLGPVLFIIVFDYASSNAGVHKN